tara:strand:- start:139 stop:843 length:705 start_codon:yes stop_codon:yes gene_type:complete
MNYKKHYRLLIEKALDRPRPTEYTEKHHILPKCMGGLDDAENIVRLDGREHFLAHKLLCWIYPDNEKLWYAFSMMAVSGKGQSRKSMTSRDYSRAREALLPARKARGREMAKYPRTEAYREKMRQVRLKDGVIPPYRGKAVLQYSIWGEFIAEFKSADEAGRKVGVKTVQIAVNGTQAVSAESVWIHKGDEELLEERLKRAQEGRIPCPHCGKLIEGQPWNMKKWHYEKCKEAP